MLHILSFLKFTFTSFYNGFVDIFWYFFTSFYEWVFESTISLIESALNLSGVNISIEWSEQLWNDINFFFPLNESLAMLTIVFGVWLTCFIVKITLKIIPTVY